MKHNKIVKLKATEYEHTKISELAKSWNMTVSDMLRVLLFVKDTVEEYGINFRDFLIVADGIRRQNGLPKIDLTPAPPVEPELLSGISYVGNNINQIAKQVNTQKKESGNVDVLKVLALLTEQYEILQNIKTMYTR